jgi:hypothetical protein
VSNKAIMSREDLLKEWEDVLDHEDYDPIVDKHRRVTTAQLLENYVQERDLDRQILQEAAPVNNIGQSSSTPGAGNIDTFDTVLISMMRRAVPMLMAYDIMGTQAMTQPVQLVFSLRSTYKTQAGTEALFNEADSAFSGTSSNNMSGSPVTNTGSPWSNAVTSGTDFGNVTSNAAFNFGYGMERYAAEELGDANDNHFQEMAFKIDQSSVTARSRALKAEYTRELAQDLKSVHGLDAEAELANILSTEIVQEINREMIRRVYYAAKLGAQVNTATAGIFDLDVDSNGRWNVEKFKGLRFQLDREANAIARESRRGRGNFIVCSSDVASALEAAGQLQYNPQMKQQFNIDDTGSTFAGTMGRYKVFIDPYFTAATSGATAGLEFAVTGYRGASPYDAGIFYCPYIGMEMARAVGENTFQPKIAYKTRYGVLVNPFVSNTNTFVPQTNYYYRRIAIKNLM